MHNILAEMSAEIICLWRNRKAPLQLELSGFAFFFVHEMNVSVLE